MQQVAKFDVTDRGLNARRMHAGPGEERTVSGLKGKTNQIKNTIFTN